eukprot:149028_1
MVEYDTKSNKIVSVTPIPNNIRPHGHSVCKYKHEIVIVDGNKQKQIVTFNPHSKEFEIKCKIPKIGEHTACIAVNDEIHIFGGQNSQSHYVYSFKQNKLKTLKDPVIKDEVTHICVTQYQNKIIRFSGYRMGAYYSKLVISDAAITPNTDHDVTWKTMPVWKCHQRVIRCGYIAYKHYIIMFGGSAKRGKTVSIYVLNVLNKDKGWIELKHLKCPIKSNWVAVLDGNNDVHLVSTTKRAHYSIPISAILTKDITEDIAANDTEDQKDDIKEENDNNTKQTIIQAKIGATEKKLCIDEAIYPKKKQSVDDTEDQKDGIKEENDNNTKQTIIQAKIGATEKKPRIDEALYQKKKQSADDVANPKEWSLDEVVAWICSVENGKYARYKTNFIQNEIEGDDLEYLDVDTLYRCGVKKPAHQRGMIQAIQRLLNNDDHDDSKTDVEDEMKAESNHHTGPNESIKRVDDGLTLFLGFSKYIHDMYKDLNDIHEDERCLRKTFEDQLGYRFESNAYNDRLWTKADALRWIRSKRDEILVQKGDIKYNGLNFCGASHGSTHAMICSDGEPLDTATIRSAFAPNVNDAFQHMPKVFIFNCCRTPFSKIPETKTANARAA